MQGIVAAVFLMTTGALAATAPLPAGNGELELTVRTPNGESCHMTVAPSHDSRSVDIDYSTGTGAAAVRKRSHFDGEVLAELRKAWGAQTFDVSHWPADSGCETTVSWRVKYAGQVRTLCRNKKITARLGEFQSIVQLIMADGTRISPAAIEDASDPKTAPSRESEQQGNPSRRQPQHGKGHAH